MPCLRLLWASQPPSAARRLPMAAAGIDVSAPYFLHRSLKLEALECAVLHTWVYLSCHPWAWISGDGAELWRRWSTPLSRVWQGPSLGAPISVNLSATTLFLPCLYISTFSRYLPFHFNVLIILHPILMLTEAWVVLWPIRIVRVEKSYFWVRSFILTLLKSSLLKLLSLEKTPLKKEEKRGTGF